MKKIIYCCLVVMTISTISSAQIMIRGGVNYSNISIDSQVDNEIFDRKPGFHVGLNGNVLTQPYDRLKHLATHSWFKILWKYV